MKMKKVLLSMLHQTAYITAKVRNKYVNGVATGEIEFVSVTLMTPVGEVQMLFPAREGAAEEFNRRYAFLQKVAPEELGIITDTQIAVYDGGLSIKILANYLDSEVDL
ncbi:MAG: hypothetical protein ACLT5W_05620 [Ruminococcus sp.]